MIGAMIKIDQAMDSWLISAQVYEALEPGHREWLGGHGLSLEMTEEEQSGDLLTAILSALGRWLEMTSAGHS